MFGDSSVCMPAQIPRRSGCKTRDAAPNGVPTYAPNDTTGVDLGLLEHPAPNLEPGDVVAIPMLVTARIEAEPGLLAALLEARSRSLTA